MPEPLEKIALVYTNDAYVELLERRPNAPIGTAQGLMGRQVAGKEFLDAYFQYGRWRDLIAVVFNQAGIDSLVDRFQSHPSNKGSGRQLRLVGKHNFHSRFFTDTPARVLHYPCPFDVKYAWARAAWGPGAFSLSGLTHTISSANTIRFMSEIVAAPVESFDTMICISKAAEASIRKVANNYADYLNDRHGGNAKLRCRLANIPLGVNSEKFRPASPEERRKERAALGISQDAIVVLYVGRLNFAGKVHPYPMHEAVSQAARATGRPVHMVFAGWAPGDMILRRFEESAAAFAPNVKCTFVDGTSPEHRSAVWHCADIFTSLTDNIQETLSQTILEAMASGLPVVATNWDGCRDQVIDGENGFLIPTYMVRGANSNLSSRHLIEEVDYDFFLGESNQLVAVDVPSAAAAFAKLIENADLRRQMGEAGRRRAVKHFAWSQVIGAYENLWAEQEVERKAFVANMSDGVKAFSMPALYPPLEESFGSYPMAILEAGDIVRAPEDAADHLELVLKTPIANYLADHRCTDRAILVKIQRKAADGCTIADLDDLLEGEEIPQPKGRATIAWMLKYRLLVAATPAL